MPKITLKWYSDPESGMQEAYFVNGSCIGVYQGVHGGIVQTICEGSDGIILFEEEQLNREQWRELILKESGWMPRTND